MYIQTPTAIPISPLEFARFTQGDAYMDLVDITFMGKLSQQDITSTQAQIPSTANHHQGNHTTSFNDPRKNIINNPGSFVYRLDLTLDAERLEGSTIEGLQVEISSKPFALYVKEDYQDPNALDNKAAIIARVLEDRSSIKKLKVVIDYRADLNIAKRRNLAEAAQQKSDLMEQQVFYSAAAKTPTNSMKTPVIASMATSPTVALPNDSLKSLIKKTITAGIDPFEKVFSQNAHLSLESKFSLSSNDVFDFEEDAVRIKSQNIMGETSLSAIRAANLSKHFESVGYSESSKEAQRLANFLNNLDTPRDKVQLGLVGTIETKQFRVLRDIEIPKSILGMHEKFYVRITPLIKSQGTTDALLEPAPFDFSVNHVKQVGQLMLPVIPPVVQVVENLPGKISLRVDTVEPNKQINIVRKIFDPRNGAFTHNKSVKTTVGIRTDIDLPNFAPNKVYYTVSSVSEDGMIGPATNVVVDCASNPNAEAKEEDQSVKIYAVNTSAGIRVNVSNIEPEIKTVRVMREHMSGIGDRKSKLKAIKLNRSSENTVVQKERSFTVVDTDVNQGHQYRYYAICKETRGLGYQTEDDDIIIRKYPQTPLPYDVYCGDPVILSADPSLRIGINISVQHKQDSYEFFLELLRNSGADKSFLDEIKRNRKYLADVIAFNVDRIDTTTGRKVNLGLRGPGQLVDGATPTGNGMGLQPGRKYVYIIKVCIKPIQGFFSNLFSGLTNPNQTSGTKITTFMTKKFMDSAERFLGALPSDKDIRESGNPRAELVASETGLTFIKTLKTAKLRARVEDLVFTKMPFSTDTSVMLSFRLRGGPKTEVLRAFIYCKTRTGTNCIGSLAIDPDGDLYYFVDKIKHREVGTKTYTVRLLYTDLKFSAHSTELVSVRQSSLLSSFTKANLSEVSY